jgi:hypothetical protein
MRNLLLVGLVALSTVLTSAAAQSEVIDSGGMAWETSYPSFLGPSAAGGTFTMSVLDNTLTSFSLWLGVDGGVQANSLRAIVMQTDSFGVPTGTPIWESADFEAIGARSEYNFNMHLVLTPGEQYFVGVDSGLYTAATGGDFTIQASGPEFLGDDAIVGGEFFENPWNGGWGALSGDVRTTIVTIVNPEPTTGLMMGLGLAILSFKQRRTRSGPN